MMEKEKCRSMFDAFYTEHKNPIRHQSGWVFFMSGLLSKKDVWV